MKSIKRDRLNRRNRFHRCPNGKQLRLTKRDELILQYLYRYRYLSRDQLIRLINPKSQKRLVERLGDLFHEVGLISRFETSANTYAAYCTPNVYEISNKGIDYLEHLDALPLRAVTFSRRRCRSHRPQLEHKLMIVETLVGIGCELRDTTDQRFVPVDEILARAPEAVRRTRNPLSIPIILSPCKDHPIVKRRMETHLIPDALYGIEYIIHEKKRYRFWALECERTTPLKRSNTQSSSRALKAATYAVLLKTGAYKKHWGIPNLKLHLAD